VVESDTSPSHPTSPTLRTLPNYMAQSIAANRMMQSMVVTTKEASRLMTEFNDTFSAFTRFRDRLRYVTRAPKRGGTYYYCTQPVEREVPKLNKLGRRTGRTKTVKQPCDLRYRRLKTYRRHWRRSHLRERMAEYNRQDVEFTRGLKADLVLQDESYFRSNPKHAVKADLSEIGKG
jgi:hypothetical protein